MRKADTHIPNSLHLPSSTNAFNCIQDYNDELLVPQRSCTPLGQLEVDFQLSSDLGDDEEDEQIKELQRICASERFSIQSSEEKHLANTTTGECKQKRKRRQTRKKNKLLIKSYSEHFTEEFCVEEEEVQEEQNYYWPDPSSEDPAVQEFFKDWEAYWESNGENILWESWNEKYKDFISPNYDFVSHIKNVSLCSDSSSSEGEYEAEEGYNSTNATMEGLVTVKLSEATRQFLNQRKEQENYKFQSTEEDELENVGNNIATASMEGLVSVKLSKATRQFLKQRKEQENYKFQSTEEDELENMDNDSTNGTMEGLVSVKLSKATRQFLKRRKEQENYKSQNTEEDELENVGNNSVTASMEGLVSVKLSKATRQFLKRRKEQENYKSQNTEDDELENVGNNSATASMEGLVSVKLSKATRQFLNQRKEQENYKFQSTEEDELENMDNDCTNGTMEGLVTVKLSEATRQFLKRRKEQENYKSQNTEDDELENLGNDSANATMEGLVTVKLSEKTRQLLKRKKNKVKSNRTDGEESKNADEMWQETWDNHCQEGYANEYQKYVKKHMKMRKVSIGCENDPRIRKYFVQRYKLFSKYDEGIKMDYESWFSVTPEMIASHIADRFSILGQSAVILDAFAGCGGNTIQFAKLFDKVIAVDIDPIKIDNCRHNSKIYGVEDKIEFIVGDFMKLAATLTADAVFISPPWGGPDYQSASVFDIETMIPMNGATLFKTAKTISENIGYFLPRNVDQNQILKLGEGNFVDIEKNYVNDKVKTVTAYFGNLIVKT